MKVLRVFMPAHRLSAPDAKLANARNARKRAVLHSAFGGIDALEVAERIEMYGAGFGGSDRRAVTPLPGTQTFGRSDLHSRRQPDASGERHPPAVSSCR